MGELDSAARAKAAGGGRFSGAGRWLVLLLTAVSLTGCVALAERIASRLAANDLEALESDLEVFEADLAMFRQCLRQRGGSCQGGVASPLLHTSQEAAGHSAGPIDLRPTGALDRSVAELDPGHPVRAAYSTLTHPVAQQAAALHDHLRGHSTPDVEGVRVSSTGTNSSRFALHLEVDQLEQFHSNLLRSTGSRQWQALDLHCRAELTKASDDASDTLALGGHCRRVAFIRGYLEAYFRHGEFIRVDVELAGAIAAVDGAAGEIVATIQKLESALAEIRQQLGNAATAAIADLQSDAADLDQKIKDLEASAATAITASFGDEAGALFSDLADSAVELVDQLDQLAQTRAAQEIVHLASEAQSLLGRLSSSLEKLEARTASLDRDVVTDIHAELSKANAALSNVFRVSNVGFVSRDATFRARLPTLELTVDPTERRLFAVEDTETGRAITTGGGLDGLAGLGVATDSSGVGTGSSIGAEIVRIFFEAIFDAQEGLPAVAPANSPDLRPTGLDLGADSLPVFESPMGNVDASDLSRMTVINERVATQTRVVLARIVEGIGPFSLNNEALESLIVEIITTSVRKAAAKATWCWFSCDLDTALERLETDAKTAGADALTAEQRKLRAMAEGEAERVSLRLGLSR